MVTQLPKDGHLPSPGLSPTIPRMVTNNPMNGHPQFAGCSPTTLRMAIHHHLDGHLSSPKFSTPITKTVLRRTNNYYPHDGQPPFPGLKTTNSRMVTNHLQVDQPEVEFDSSTAQLVVIPDPPPLPSPPPLIPPDPLGVQAPGVKTMSS